MAIEHRTRPIYGVQFHPESIDSECGHQIIQNFLRLAKQAHGPVCEGPRPMATLRAALNQVGAPKDMPCKFQLLDASYDPAATFKTCFAHCSAAFWLDSELSEQTKVRHSIMGDCSPQHALKFTYDVSTRVLTIQGPSGQTEVSGDFFQLMDDIFAALPYNGGGCALSI